LQYDYIGSPWLYTDGKNVGNGGFSLRSRLLQIFLANDEFINASDPEDQAIGRLYRDYLIKTYSIKFAPEDLADQFAYELRTPIYDTFGFHGAFHKPYQPTVVIKRTAAMGDVILVEPVLHYFYKNGYRVVLDTLDQFYMLFVNHYFPVHHPKKIDGRLLPSAEHYNLDMAYEAFPTQNRLKSYYQFCGIKDGEMRNPKLSLGFELHNGTKLSIKFCVIHLEGIRQSGRNVFGVDWESVVANIQARGYTVFQVGKRNVPLIKNAIYLNTMNENFLCWVVGTADFFIGIDSGVSHVASAFNVPSILFFGNTNPEIVHPDLSNKTILTRHVSSNPICNKPYCWHEQIGVESNECYVDAQLPPCAKYTTAQVLEAVDKIIENGA
jgi:ADP-heptose:LPS heptosyltransferase